MSQAIEGTWICRGKDRDEKVDLEEGEIYHQKAKKNSELQVRIKLTTLQVLVWMF